MSEYMEFTPKGLVLHKWSNKKRAHVRKRPDKLKILSYLRNECKIAPGTTFKNILNAVNKYKLLKIFVQQYSWCGHLQEFLDLVNEPQRTEKTPLTYLEIYWHPEIHQYMEKVTHPGGHREKIKVVSFDAHAGFHGWGPPENEAMRDPRNPEGLISYSVSWTPMYNLADCPVKLNHDFTIQEPTSVEKIRKGEMPKDLVKSTRTFSLLEVLDAIFDDISFYGGPEDIKKLQEEMTQRVEEMNEGLVPGIPWEQVQKRLGLEDEVEEKEIPVKIILHPEVSKFFGVNPDEIPLDDKEIPRDEATK